MHAGHVRALTARQAERVTRAHALLRQKDYPAATALASALVQDAPDAPDAFLLLGMCLADAGTPDDADAAFARAWSLAPQSELVALNVAQWCRRRGRLDDALQVLQSPPPTARLSLQQGLLHLARGAAVPARAAFEDVLAREPDSIQALHGLASALQASGALDEADTVLARLTVMTPGYAPAWINRGAVLRLLGRLDAALDCFQRAAVLGGHNTPEIANAVNGLQQDKGRPHDALTGARALIVRHPDFVPGHEALAHLLWEQRSALETQTDPLQAFRAAAHAQPAHYALQIAFVRTLLQARRHADALAWLQPLRSRWPGDPPLDWLSADALDALGHNDQAHALYARASPHFAATHCDFLNAHARHGLRTGRLALAQQCAEQALRLAPANQEAWSLLGILWRLADDPREDWLCDYTRLIGDVEIATPDGDADLPTFLRTLEQTLTHLHLAAGEPMAQSVRNGSQTPGRLFGRDDPVLRETARALRDAAQGWIAQLPDDPRHPFLARKQRSLRFAGSWSVCLRASGRHTNHIHDEGWLSSAFYVALPGAVRSSAADATAGWIQFGQPLETLGLDLPPRRVLQPRPGHVVLFPSYMWHGTIPFAGPDPRITIAFDAQPAP